MNLTPTIVPKSDQLNADDLITGPLTIKITAVNKGSAEQPVIIKYEGDDGHPYKPSKSMRRVLVTIWGKEAEAFIGRRITLYRDPSVRFGADVVGGIKISHASDIPEAAVILLTESRGRRKPFRVEPLAEEGAEPPSELTNLPEAWLEWTSEQRGEFVARRGTADFRKWWKTLPTPDRDILKNKTTAWKELAEEADAKVSK